MSTELSSRNATFIADFRRFFTRGLTVLLPTILTLWLLWMATVFVYQKIGDPINRGIRAAIVWGIPAVFPEQSLPDWYSVTPEQREAFLATPQGQSLGEEPSEARVDTAIIRHKLGLLWQDHWYLAGAGLVVAIVLIYLAGVLLGGFLGRKVYGRLEMLIAQVPVFKQVYPHVKQLVDLVIGERQVAFQKAVLVEYPRKGVWTVGLVTGKSMASIHEVAGKPCISVFVPSTPAPFTGFTITIPEDEAVELPISVDGAIRFFITGGALVPDGQAPAGTIQPGTEPASLESSRGSAES
jgi:uncharacterized membrane protein